MVQRQVRLALSALIRATRIGFLELHAEHSSKRLGIAWLPITSVAFAAMLALIFHPSEGVSRTDFFLYVLAGYTLWSFIARSFSEGIGLIQKKFEFAIHSGLDLRGLFLKALIDRLIEYTLNLVALLVLVFLLKPAAILSAQVLLLAPFFVVISVASVSVSYVVNLITVYFPDSAPLIGTGVRLLFFASPVFWSETDGGHGSLRDTLATFNPVSYYLDLSRQASGLAAFRLEDWLIAMAITAVVSALAAFAFNYSRDVVRNVR